MTNVTTTGAAQLIPTFLSTIGGASVMCCDARPLHGFLENGDKFAGWIKSRIDKYGFEQGVDFECLSVKTETQRTDGQLGAATSTDYHLTLDMGKELSMVENNQKGREARRYFLDCEKQAMGATVKPPVSSLPNLDVNTLVSLINGGLIDKQALLKIANASGMALYITVTNDAKDTSWGEQVASQINASLPQSDLRVIVTKATMELWARNMLPASPSIPVPQRTQFAQPARVTSFKLPKVSAREYVLRYITKSGTDGVAHRELHAGCRPFRNLEQQARDALLEELIQDGSIVTTRTKTGRGVVFKIKATQ